MKAISDAASEMEQTGIVATADIANGDHTLEHKSNSRHYFHTFIEVFGSDPGYSDFIIDKAIQLKDQFKSQQVSGAVSIVPHATYSLSEGLFEMVASYAKGNLISIHHQENTDENNFFKDGSGPITARRKVFNPGLADFQGTGKRPLESIAWHFDSEQRILLVHNTVTKQQDINFAKKYFSHVYWCLCPNANLFIENSLPDINLFLTNKCRITLGTDSLASNHQLSILEEIKTIQQNFPHIRLGELIRWGTLNGAEFLGLGQALGSFEKGKSPGVVLIENVDIDTLQLKPSSTSHLIIPARI
jgi:cytosine/adenosine deaminase-related metal-dependent hydrolase